MQFIKYLFVGILFVFVGFGAVPYFVGEACVRVFRFEHGAGKSGTWLIGLGASVLAFTAGAIGWMVCELLKI